MITSNFKVCLHHHSSQEREKPEDGVDKIYFKEIYKDWLSRCNQNKIKNSCSTYYSFNVFFSIITYNFLLPANC